MMYTKRERYQHRFNPWILPVAVLTPLIKWLCIVRYLWLFLNELFANTLLCFCLQNIVQALTLKEFMLNLSLFETNICGGLLRNVGVSWGQSGAEQPVCLCRWSAASTQTNVTCDSSWLGLVARHNSGQRWGPKGARLYTRAGGRDSHDS